MRSRATRLSLLATVAVCAFGAIGCADPEPDPVAHASSGKTAVANEAGEAAATKFREDVAALSVVISACATPESRKDPTCPSQVLSAIRGGEAGQLHTQGIIDFNALYQQVLKRIAKAGKRSLCSYLNVWKGYNNVYYNRGSSVTAGAARTYAAGAELVYDIGDRQMAMYTFKSKGWGNILGASVGVYGGFAFSKNRHGLFDAWSGSTWSANGSYGVPETEILGINGSVFTNDEHDVVGVAAGVSVGFNFINAWGADLSIMRNEYTPWNAGTREFEPAGATRKSSGGYDYWDFQTKDGLGSGWWLALEMVRFELEIADGTNKYSLYVSQPTWAAALLTIGSEYVRFETASKSIEDWCSGYAFVPNDQQGGGCGDLGTASVGPRTCSSEGTLDTEVDHGGFEFPLPEIPAAATSDCSEGGAAACDARFPGRGLVCSTSAQADLYCCRKPFEAKGICYSDYDCADDEVCAAADGDPDSTKPFGCMKPGSQPCITE